MGEERNWSTSNFDFLLSLDGFALYPSHFFHHHSQSIRSDGDQEKSKRTETPTQSELRILDLGSDLDSDSN